ncbi:MAG: hypothetical protein KA508_06905 [Gammaproteobacteria bacterium]|nr:hypothetical protein [Gammaproteobacteria bacterium]
MLRMFEQARSNINRPSFVQQASRLSSSLTATASHKLAVAPMPLLDQMGALGKGYVNFNRTAFFGIQHILRTNVPLFQHLIDDLGANPQYIFLSGKGYSDNEEAEHLLENTLGIRYFKLNPAYAAMPGKYQEVLRTHLRNNWDLFLKTIKGKDIEKIVVFDEGGHCFETMPESLCFKYSMVGIEQTRGGLYSPSIEVLPFPLIEVASSALKRSLESPLIIEAVISKLKKLLQRKNTHINEETVFGVVGNGAIGSHLTQYLLSSGHHVMAFDENATAFVGPSWKQKNFYRARDIREVIVRASYIFGCTGKDITQGASEYLHTLARDKVFVSCTSEDKEFKTLLRTISENKDSRQLEDPAFLEKESELRYISESGGVLTVLGRGFPINFDHSGESVPADQIQLTRALMLAAFIQGSTQAQTLSGEGRINTPPRIMVHPFLQQYIARQFHTYQSSNTLLANKWQSFEDLHWIANQSSGQVIEDTTFFEHFQEHVNKAGTLRPCP